MINTVIAIPECTACRLPLPICICKETFSLEASKLIGSLSSYLNIPFITGEGIYRKTVRKTSPMEEDEEKMREWSH